MSFNSREYEWADITLSFGGVEFTGIRMVKYKTKREQELIYAKGSEPHSIQKGNKSYEGEFEILQSDFNALEDASGDDITNVRGDILVSYGNPLRGDVIRTKKISSVSIGEFENEGKQGDKFMPVKIPFIALAIKNI